MESREELQAVLEVRDRLQRKFSHVRADEVARTVDRLGHVPTQRTSPPI